MALFLTKYKIGFHGEGLFHFIVCSLYWLFFQLGNSERTMMILFRVVLSYGLSNLFTQTLSYQLMQPRSRRYSLSGWPRSGWPLSTTLCYKSVTGLNHHTGLLLMFYMVGSDIRKKYWKFHNDTVNSFGVMGKGNAIFQPYFHVTMSHFKFSYSLNSCPHKIEELEQFVNFWLHSKYGFI